MTSFISEKITIVPGDITCETLGINDLNLSLEISTAVDVVINLAATTNFDERYEKLILIVQITKSRPYLLKIQIQILIKVKINN